MIMIFVIYSEPGGDTVPKISVLSAKAQREASRLEFSKFDVSRVLNHGASLLGSAGSEYELEVDVGKCFVFFFKQRSKVKGDGNFMKIVNPNLVISNSYKFSCHVQVCSHFVSCIIQSLEITARCHWGGKKYALILYHAYSHLLLKCTCIYSAGKEKTKV